MAADRAAVVRERPQRDASLLGEKTQAALREQGAHVFWASDRLLDRNVSRGIRPVRKEDLTPEDKKDLAPFLSPEGVLKRGDLYLAVEPEKDRALRKRDERDEARYTEDNADATVDQLSLDRPGIKTNAEIGAETTRSLTLPTEKGEYDTLQARLSPKEN